VHGLASNARTWDGVARRLSEAGNHVVAVDQRGHGLSDKPETGYGFDEVTADLSGLIEALGWERPLLAGQSWGGNVVIDFATRWPEKVSGLVLVDGGFIELSSAPDASWEKVAVDLKPPPLAGTPRAQIKERIGSFHPEWDDEMLEATMANFETLADGTVRPWLSLEHHMAILRAIWEQKPSELYGRVKAPALIAVAESSRRESNPRKRDEVAVAERALAKASALWFKETAHDIHVEKPAELADWILAAVRDGFFD
jgi:pimeloyl-ACP methyl ester carboxylesterase